MKQPDLGKKIAELRKANELHPQGYLFCTRVPGL